MRSAGTIVVDDEGRGRARAAVQDALVELRMSPTEFARKADIDADTVVGFLSGRRWPQVTTRHAMAVAIGWTPASIDRIARGESPESADPPGTVGAGDQDAGVLLSLPPEALEGLSDADREEVIAAARLSALERAREIRRRLDS